MSRRNPSTAIPASLWAAILFLSAAAALAQPDPTASDTWESAPADSAPAAAKPPERAEAPPDRNGGFKFPAGLVPVAILVGPQAGVQASRLQATTEYRQLVEPTEGKGAWKSLSWGAAFSLRWRSGFTLTASPRRETYGLETREETVSFSGNPFPHTLRSRTRLSYNVWPLLAGMGWKSHRQHLQAQAGAYVAYLDGYEMEWTVDGQPSSRRPAVGFRMEHSGWMAAMEYGYRFGKGELVLGLETVRANESAMEGLRGSIRPEGAQVRASYLWNLLGE